MKPTSWSSVAVVVILLSFTGLSALALSFDYIVQNDCAEFSYLEQSLSNVPFAPPDVIFQPFALAQAFLFTPPPTIGSLQHSISSGNSIQVHHYSSIRRSCCCIDQSEPSLPPSCSSFMFCITLVDQKSTHRLMNVQLFHCLKPTLVTGKTLHLLISVTLMVTLLV